MNPFRVLQSSARVILALVLGLAAPVAFAGKPISQLTNAPAISPGDVVVVSTNAAAGTNHQKTRTIAGTNLLDSMKLFPNWTALSNNHSVLVNLNGGLQVGDDLLINSDGDIDVMNAGDLYVTGPSVGPGTNLVGLNGNSGRLVAVARINTTNLPSVLAGDGAAITALNAAQLATGQVPNGRLTQSNALNGSFTGDGGALTNVPNVVSVQMQSRSSGFSELRHFMTNLMDGTKPIKVLMFTDQAPADQWPGSVIWRASWAGLCGLNGGMFGTGGSDGDLATADSGGSTVTDANVWNFNGGLRSITSGNTRTWYRISSGPTPGIRTTNFFIDSATFFYVRETNAGTFKIQTNLAGAGWGDFRTIDCSLFGTNGGATNISLTPGYYSLRVNGASGTCRIIGAQLYYSATNAYIGGGLGMASPAGTKESFLDVPTNIVWPIFSALHPNLVLYLDTLGTVVPPYSPENVPDQFNRFITNTMPEADVIWIASHYPGDTSLATFEAANQYMRNKCQQFGWAYFDTEYYLGTNTDAQKAAGFLQSNGHIDTTGCRYLDNRLWHDLMMNMAIINAGHVGPQFVGNEANLFNNSRTNALGLGTATPKGRLNLLTGGYGDLRWDEISGPLPGLWVDVNGTIGATDTANNHSFMWDQSGAMYIQQPVPASTEIIFGAPFPGVEFGRLWGNRGFSIGNLNGAGNMAGGAVRGPGQGVIAAQGGYYMCNADKTQITPAPKVSGDSFFWNSNGYPYMIVSTNGGGGVSAAWTGTNKVGW